MLLTSIMLLSQEFERSVDMLLKHGNLDAVLKEWTEDEGKEAGKHETVSLVWGCAYKKGGHGASEQRCRRFA